MIGLGVLYVPLDSIVKVFSIGYVLVCVFAMMNQHSALPRYEF